MTVATYHFTRDASSGRDGVGRLRASTEAVGIVRSWATMAEGRSCDHLQEEDDYLVATLSWNDSETSAADLDLETLCDAAGIWRAPVAR